MSFGLSCLKAIVCQNCRLLFTTNRNNFTSTWHNIALSRNSPSFTHLITHDCYTTTAYLCILGKYSWNSIHCVSTPLRCSCTLKRSYKAHSVSIFRSLSHFRSIKKYTIQLASGRTGGRAGYTSVTPIHFVSLIRRSIAWRNFYLLAVSTLEEKERLSSRSSVTNMCKVLIKKKQGHPTTVFCKRSVRRSKYCLEIDFYYLTTAKNF